MVQRTVALFPNEDLHHPDASLRVIMPPALPVPALPPPLPPPDFPPAHETLSRSFPSTVR